ncbi:hypothetical protein D3C73_455490 [compost metagenome]
MSISRNIKGDVVIIIAIFFTLFPVNFIFFPSGLSSRLIVAVFGLIMLFYKTTRKGVLNTNRNVSNLFLISFAIAIWSYLCTVIFNNIYDYTYVKHPYTIFVMLLACSFCSELIEKRFGSVTFEIVAKYFVYAILLQSFITLLIFFSSPFGDLMNSIQRLGDRELLIIGNHLTNQTRFIGFGVVFYNASFFFGSALLFIAYLLRFPEYIQGRKRYWLYYLIIAFVGMGLSRSTMIGIFISLFVYLYPSKVDIVFFRRIAKLLFFSLLIFFSVYLLLNLFPSINSRYEGFIDNVFEVFVNYNESGEIDSKSAEGTFSTFRLPDYDSTYLFGTGYYEQYSSIGDFSYSDIGYLRLLFYSGVVGLFLFFIFEITLLKMVLYNRGYKLVFFGMILILLLTNIKGLTMLSVITLMFFRIRKQNLLN